MAKKISIPISDHTTAGVCTLWYQVDYKLNSEIGYTSIPPVYAGTVEINNLLAASTYNVRIVRNCCDGVQSAALVLTVNT